MRNDIRSIEVSPLFMLQEIRRLRIEQNESMFDRLASFQERIDVKDMMIDNNVDEV